jgi:hypothetical protein
MGPVSASKSLLRIEDVMKFCQGCAFLAALAAPLTARATTFDHHWCFNWKAVNLDTNIGEDFNLTSTWTARGARIGVQHAVAGNQPVMYTNVGTGCVDFQSTASSNFTVTIYAETKVGASGNIIVRSFATEANYVSWRDGPGAPSATLEQWLWLGVTPACTGTNCTLTMTNTSGTDPVSNMIAVGTQVLHKIDGETTPRISGTVELALINEPCGGAGGSGSCFRRESGEPHIAWIQSTDNGDQRKFLIAHETGHLLHDVRSGFPAWGGNPWVIATGHHTRCDSAGIPGAHALRSEELSSGAFIEGFAHYMATLTFNSHLSTSAWFKYYKDDTSTGGPLPELCQNLGQRGAMGSKPEQADPLKSPQFAGMRPVGGLRGGLRGSARLRLEVAVDQADLVGGGEARGGLAEHLEDLAPGPGLLLEPCPEGQAVDKLHGDVDLAVVGADLVDADDVGVGQAGHGLGLAQEAGGGVGVGAVAVQELDGDLALELLVVGGVDDPSAAAAELADDGEAADRRGTPVLRPDTSRGWRCQPGGLATLLRPQPVMSL